MLATPWPISRRPPHVGEHTEEILGEDASTSTRPSAPCAVRRGGPFVLWSQVSIHTVGEAKLRWKVDARRKLRRRDNGSGIPSYWVRLQAREDPAMTKVEFFFDPMCPWAYQASRWIREVAGQRDLDIQWRFFSLEEAHWEPGKKHPWEREWSYGFSLLRIAAFVRRELGGNAAVGQFYARAGERLHESGCKVHTPDGARAVLDELGWGGALLDAVLTSDDSIEEVRSEHVHAVGAGVFGVPTLGFDDGRLLFGPVIAPAPTGELAVRLWDHLDALAAFPHLYELQRPKRNEDNLHIRSVFAPFARATDSAEQ